jgi:3'-phosphoadenosine 5'-phosphosulfate sulfotransferase (PAPS reductase)/FAD synthetase
MTNDPNWPDWLSAAEQTIAQAVDSTEHTALLYSGGVESSLLLHLADPWRDRMTIYTVRTGAEFPHMVAFMDRKLKDWDHRVITADLVASFEQLGLPASVVPIEHTPVTGMLNINERRPRIVPWAFCCSRNRWQPGCEAIKRGGIGAVIHGQRAGDYPKRSPAPATRFCRP